MNKTAIEWVKNPDGTPGYTWNPITGCLNHKDGLCLGGGFPCYAYRLAHGRLKGRYLANMNTPDILKSNLSTAGNDAFYPRFWRERLDDLEIPPKARDWQKPRGIFVCDMGELFGDWIPDEWRTLVFYMMALNPQHRFYLLTKQPQNLIKFSPFPDNCWVGVTATNIESYERAWRYLKSYIKAKVKYISFEPLLEDITPSLKFRDFIHFDERDKVIDWVIIGAQTKPYKPPKIEWVKEIHDAADKVGIPIFIKDNLFPLFNSEMGYINKSWLRQELPDA